MGDPGCEKMPFQPPFNTGTLCANILTNSSLPMLLSFPKSLTISLTTAIVAVEGQCCCTIFFGSASLTSSSIESGTFFRLVAELAQGMLDLQGLPA